MKTISQIEAKRKLAASIRNEQRHYDQERFVIQGAEHDGIATCGTACCIAGHIEACWPRVAARLAKLPEFHPSCDCCKDDIFHGELANAVWQEVTGKPCRFKFGVPPFDPTREDAVAHIYGRHKRWPLKQVEGEAQ